MKIAAKNVGTAARSQTADQTCMRPAIRPAMREDILYAEPILHGACFADILVQTMLCTVASASSVHTRLSPTSAHEHKPFSVVRGVIFQSSIG